MGFGGAHTLNRRVLITGGSRGLGEHLARSFWGAGYHLVLVSRNLLDCQHVVENLPRRDRQKTKVLSCDLADPEKVDGFIREATSSIDKLDVLINNAAIQGPIGDLSRNSLRDWDQTIRVNLLSPVALCKGFVPLLRESKDGCIINLSGGGATAPRPNFSAYAAAKAALVRFSETIAEELSSAGIRVNCIAPGAMKTLMLEAVLSQAETAGEREATSAKQVLMSGVNSMDRVSALALFLASDSAKGITGKLISAVWDNWEDWPRYLDRLTQSDVYTLRRIVGRDRGMDWADK
jgi:3-oxoacyl-[acyl-carrier protein] reductase